MELEAFLEISVSQNSFQISVTTENKSFAIPRFPELSGLDNSAQLILSQTTQTLNDHCVESPLC